MYDRQDIIEMLHEYNVKFIRLQFTDILGIPKNIAIPVSQFHRAVAGDIMLDGSSIRGLTGIEDSDMYLKPDLNTFTILPWRPKNGQVAKLICDIYTSNHEPFAGCPRINLKRIIKEAKALGYTMNAGAEAEFFLFLTDEKGKPTTITHDKAGYFDMSPIDLGEDARRAMVLALEQMGFEVEAAHHEVAEGQHEISFRYSNALDMADKIITSRIVIKAIAQSYGLHATFMPKPIRGIDGSGMHTHQSLFQGDENIFWEADAPMELSETALYYIGGLVKHAKAITAVTNPTVNSYKRLVPGYDAPVYIAWSTKNRNAFIRIPAKRGISTRLEMRSPDATCNPYLALSVMLKAGLDGIINKIEPPAPFNRKFELLNTVDAQLSTIDVLPTSLAEAIQFLEDDQLIQQALGTHIAEHFIKLKKEEWNQYRMIVHQWETDQYLGRY
ncbi:type I glutamate--ammonia ligase [Desulfuribacillus stibiiarsenatis]|uniref:Glutamine synthetase n=1 Tax=Desulfuribacillus stibiiarsenatis TaxID=1390249 RepID=A0A1E5L3J0_9FIRM|nr:type I glutamate--ammonia ligase [Desulfuribacillus stibiiarsenatis]OEH84633.1 type I glutamate--ammonia ligase [Desulfuribacillus stibiiarsenatis]